MLPRTHWQRHIARLDPDTDFEEIYRIVAAHEFPWDLHQAMSFALFRTYAVPAIGRLLAETGELEQHTQKRYDDTVLLLDEPLRSGLHSDAGRRAVRRINQMYAGYHIAPADMRYVLSTFVVVPKRWLDAYGWRPLSPAEVRASVHYYRELGRLMGIRDVPATYAAFEELMDSYEARHFATDDGGRRVADATLRLLASFYPAVPRRPVEVLSRALMDEPLLAAFGYSRPSRPVLAAVRAAMRARARVEGLLPARRLPRHSVDLPRIRSYPDGYRLEELGTFPRGCPRPQCLGLPGTESA
jgi:ER-bound oxygenase mpaB/B'/Rubber oxygenase, catalytic domain